MPDVKDVALAAILNTTHDLLIFVAERIKSSKVRSIGSGSISDIILETERQENEMRRLEAQARVAQEMAIAGRINSAQEVHLEEHYEYAGDARFAAKADASSVTGGLSGGGRRISKKVYRFSGFGDAQASIDLYKMLMTGSHNELSETSQDVESSKESHDNASAKPRAKRSPKS